MEYLFICLGVIIGTLVFGVIIYMLSKKTSSPISLSKSSISGLIFVLTYTIFELTLGRIIYASIAEILGLITGGYLVYLFFNKKINPLFLASVIIFYCILIIFLGLLISYLIQ